MTMDCDPSGNLDRWIAELHTMATWSYVCHANLLLGTECTITIGDWRDRSFPVRVINQETA